jgi:hypothetical protein
LPAVQRKWHIRRALLLAAACGVVGVFGAVQVVQQNRPKISKEVEMNDELKNPKANIGLDISVTGTGNPVAGVEIVNSGGGVGSEVSVVPPAGGSAVGVRSIVTGPGATGLKVIQNGPGIGLKVTVGQ